MHKSPDAFRSIGEVAQLIGVAPHVLRYWEAQFDELSPVKRADGRRYYRLDDVHLAAGLCEVLREDGLTIRGAKRLIAADRGHGLRTRGAERLSGVLGRHKDDPDTARPSAAAAAPRENAAAICASKSTGTQGPAGSAGPSTGASRSSETKDDRDWSASWLTRLTTTANHLRSRTEPLPDEAGALVHALHEACAEA
ncbi:MerR family transcriptional regulator [uncultured Paracoccus sp.]|uniref:MerR family transcriptional regulator n=1 Tax=uncultured Paracoccus sp. TaxID=189685 RepID=UPI00262E9B90|nr:MerR family transcriptional regulator [uncultured Paracoccus sp.]